MGFGIYIPHLSLSFDQMVERALRCLRLGYEPLWLYDHVYGPGMADVPFFEAWTLATALLARTTRLRVGHLVLCNSFRHPALLAKMATACDVISQGRLDLGIGSGSVEEEHHQLGLPWGPDEMFAEVVSLSHKTGLMRPWNDPDAALRRAMAGSTSTILSARDDVGSLIGTAIVCNDGHRG